MTRLACIIIAIYNVALVGTAWGLLLFKLLSPLQLVPNAFFTIINLVLILLFLVHSIQLVRFHETSRKKQIILSFSTAIVRLINSTFVLVSGSAQNPSQFITLMLIFIAFDIVLALLLRSTNVKNDFEVAEEKKELKFREKLMKQ